MPEDFASMILSDVLVEFSRLHPRVMLNVECELTLNLIQRFNHGDFDLILIKTNQRNQIAEGVDVWNEPVDWVGKRELLTQFNNTTPVPLILSPTPCVYRGNVIDSLDNHHLNWRLVFSSPSYAGKMAAVRAGLGITAIQRSMIPNDLDRLDEGFLPKLSDIHVSLLKRKNTIKRLNRLSFSY